ncbi:hypothetical protein B0H12DRAFT_1229156 [Mycena haematopus]|nr:hypothetical protein B0H12DRAFT_1229156 [Mycena haematopus]
MHRHPSFAPSYSLHLDSDWEPTTVPRTPTDEEVLEIRSLLVEPTLRLKSLDDKIADLQKSIDKLVEERVRLGSYRMENHRTLHTATLGQAACRRTAIVQIVGADAVYNRKMEQRLENTKTWLGRSGQCPLSISLQGIVGLKPNATAQFTQAFIPFAARWQHVDFTIPPDLPPWRTVTDSTAS